jgi:putative ABC transport system permease protein
MSGTTAWSAVRALARHELRSRWRSVIALGVASGIFFGGALATVAVLVRADSAYDRMVSATGLADARVGTYNIFNDVRREQDVLQELSLIRGSILKRTDVVDSQQLTAVYARLDSRQVEYIGIWAPRHQWDGLDTPVVISGRKPSADRADEVMVNEQEAKARGLHLGDRIGVGIYRSGQVRDVSASLGTPRAGHVELVVVGIYRVADSGTGFGGLLAGPAFAARFDATAAIGEVLCLRLDRSLESPVFGTVQEQAIRLDRAMTQQFGAGFYNYVDYVEPRQAPDPAISPTEDVLRSGLGLLTIVIAVAGLVLTLQLAGRWSALGRADHGVERALGMRTREQVLARVFAALPAVLIAGVCAAAGALLGGFLEPPGALNRFEPHPGWLGQPATAVYGALAVLVLLIASITLTRAAVLRMDRVAADQVHGRAGSPGGLPLHPVLRFATALGASRGSRTRAVRSRATVLGLTVSFAMLVLVVSLGTRLTGLERTPAQWGWTADFGVVGDTLAMQQRLVDDHRVRDVDRLVDAPVHLLHNGQIVRVTGYGRSPVTGALPYRVTAGHVPQELDEIALGPRLADELGAHLGDRIQLMDLQGERFTERVAGIVVTPTLEDEPLGRNLLMSLGALRRAAISTGYSNMLIRAVDKRSATALHNELARSVEIDEPTAPSTIVALGKLNAPERLLIIVLLIGAALLVAEHLGLLIRRRGTQLAIAASIGMTRRQLVAATSSSTVLTAALAIVCGVPMGWALSRLVLVEIGPRLGVGLSGPGVLTSFVIAVCGLGLAAVLSVSLAAAGLRGRTVRDLRGYEARI